MVILKYRKREENQSNPRDEENPCRDCRFGFMRIEILLRGKSEPVFLNVYRA
jgi:hypothetical protein